MTDDQSLEYAVTNDALTWLGHATTRIDFDNTSILTDPALTTRLAHLRRHHHVDTQQAEDIDLVLISHLHMDHLHIPSLRRVGRRVPVLVPRGGGRLLEKRGFTHIVEVGRGDVVRFGNVEVHAVFADHSDSRGPQYSGTAEALGYVIECDGRRVYFAGDTDYFDDMKAMGPLDAALLPIGGWWNFLGPGHLNPKSAIDAVQALDPKLIVPIHWGTYSPARVTKRPPRWLMAPGTEFAAEMAQTPYVDRLRLLRPGERTAF